MGICHRVRFVEAVLREWNDLLPQLPQLVLGKTVAGSTHYKVLALAVDHLGRLFIVDENGGGIVILGPDGSFQGRQSNMGWKPGSLRYPSGLCVDTAGMMFVADRGNNRIQVFAPEGRFLKQWCDVGKPFGLFLTPDQTLFVTDGNPDGPHRILVLDLDGKLLATIGESGQGPGQFDMPHSVHVDGQGNLYVAEVTNKRIQKLVP